jgi:hypothetical protein
MDGVTAAVATVAAKLFETNRPANKVASTDRIVTFLIERISPSFWISDNHPQRVGRSRGALRVRAKALGAHEARSACAEPILGFWPNQRAQLQLGEAFSECTAQSPLFRFLAADYGNIYSQSRIIASRY